MALQSTTKIRLFVSSQREEEVLSFLQEREVLEVVPVLKELRIDVSHQAEFAVAKIDFALRYLSPFAPEKKGLRNVVLGEKIEISEKGASAKISGFDWEKIVNQVSALETQKNDATRELGESKMVLKTLRSFEEVDTKATEGVYGVSFFVIPVQNAERFLADTIAVSPYLEISEVSRSETSVSFVLFARSEEKLKVGVLLSRDKGSEVVVEKGVSPAQKISGLLEKISQLDSVLSRNAEETRDLVKNIDALKLCHDKFDAERKISDVRRGLQSGDFVSVAEGWVDSSQLESLRSELTATFGAVEIEEIESLEGEKSPIILKNSKLVTPFEIVTNMYGAPQSNEIDPTPFLAPFFVVFFGLCLTDAAYGLMLAAVMGGALAAKLPLDFGVKKMVRLLFYSGLSTAFFGVLFGGWFGISPDAVPAALTYVNAEGNTMFLGQIVNPTDDLVEKIAPLVLLGGLIHLLLGVALKGYIALKNDNKWDMWMVSVPTIVTISLGIVAIISGMFGVSDATQSFLIYAITVAFVIMTVGIMKSGGPITWFMDVTGWLSNTLSYARLFALGLATGIVAQVFNTVAFAIGGMMPTGLDILIIVFIILFGHTLNIALNLLGAFVHSGRLQFVEFFGQFLEGGGRYFSPLKKVDRFIHKEG